jgi:hypothetical protein
MCQHVDSSSPSIPDEPEQLDACSARPKKMQKRCQIAGQDDLSWSLEVQVLLAELDTYLSTSNAPAEMDVFTDVLRNMNDTSSSPITLVNESYLGCNQPDQFLMLPPPQPYVPRVHHNVRNVTGSSAGEWLRPNNHRAIYNKAIGPEAHL